MNMIALPAFNDNYIWIFVNEIKRTFACVDPGDAMPVLTYAKEHDVALSHILITHHHYDHVNGTMKLLEAFPQAIAYGPADGRLPFIKKTVHESDLIPIDHLIFRVLNTPGHTSSHICYQEPTERWLFCGDTLFSAGCGRVFDGTMEDLHQSIGRLKNLPKETQVFCGHEYTLQNLYFAAFLEPNNAAVLSYLAELKSKIGHCSLPSTIGLEREINPFMRTTSESLKTFGQQQGMKELDSFAIFKYLREMKDNFSAP